MSFDADRTLFIGLPGIRGVRVRKLFDTFNINGCNE